MAEFCYSLHNMNSPNCEPLQYRGCQSLLPRKWSHSRDDTIGINFIGPVEFLNGLGSSARGYLSGIAYAKIPHTVVAWRYGFEHLPKLNITYPKHEHYPVNLVHLNLDLLYQGYLDIAPLNRLVIPDRYNVCILYWELASVLPIWHDIIHRFDEIWCASSFMARAISAVSARPVRVVRPALDFTYRPSGKNRTGFGLPPSSYVFFYAADAAGIMGRKNPAAFVTAYINEFPPDGKTCCLVKINNTAMAQQEMQRLINLAQNRPDVIFLSESLSNEDMSALFHCIDCYVSPHRSEGLGLTILEAMAAKKPVIATQYGGVTDFVTRDTAYPLTYRLTEIGDGNPPYPENYIWAEPDTFSLQEHMRHVFENQEEAINQGQKAYLHIHSQFSLESASATLSKELGRIWAGEAAGNSCDC